jgi:hypothetical protein
VLTGVEWKNLDVTSIPQNETSEQTVEYTRGAASDLMVLDDNFISDAKLAIHGSTGAQLANLPNKNSVTVDGVTWSCKDNVVTAIGETGNEYSRPTDLICSVPAVPGNYYISGGVNPIRVVIKTRNISGSEMYYLNNQAFTITDDISSIKLYVEVMPNAIVNTTIKVMLNKGNVALPFECYTGGTPYTDKYTVTIVDQSEDNVTLSLENVAESVGDSTELDVVLTDKNGITKRSEVGKTFTGGE